MTLLQTILVAVVEGLTEFLPVSSTGHMIIAQKIMGVAGNSDFVKVFTVNIQFGAILSVVVLYWKRFFKTWDFYLKLLVAFLPVCEPDGDLQGIIELRDLPRVCPRRGPIETTASSLAQEPAVTTWVDDPSTRFGI